MVDILWLYLIVDPRRSVAVAMVPTTLQSGQAEAEKKAAEKATKPRRSAL